MSKDATVQKVLRALDRNQFEPGSWESEFLEEVTRQTYALTADQHARLVTFAEVYCHPQLAAELRGQQRLFG